ncbi:MAG TPA: winged helix-turn-helix transcriptional regulator [Chloroflexi bacterium]|nr:winged helix-turn-helix transcriptional regulator [Chloroflexota bacterium]
MQLTLSTNKLSETTEDAAVIEQLARQLKVLGEPNRLRIVQLLREGVQCNCELVDALDMAPNLISHHLRILREAGLVEVERDAVDARWMYYSLNRAALEQLTSLFSQFFDPARIKERHPACGPQGSVTRSKEIQLLL